MDFIRTHKLQDRCYFHVSDEPSKEHIPAYLYAKKLLESQIDGLPIMDALSDYEFYEQGLVGVPVCSNDHIRPFLETMCRACGPITAAASFVRCQNRFFCMPSQKEPYSGRAAFINIRSTDFCNGDLTSGIPCFPVIPSIPIV